MKVLVTGSRGLIGKALSISLVKMGVDVVGLDLAYSKDHKFFGSILNKAKLEDSLKDCDGVVHLAAVSRVIFGEMNPNLCIRTNCDGTRILLDSILASKKRPWIIYASSREVYGNPKILPAKETSPLFPINVYAKSKVISESFVTEIRNKGVLTAIVRYSNVYGSPEDHIDRVIPAFCRASILGSQIRIEGADNSFDFTYIEDVVDGTIKIINLLNNRRDDLPPMHLTLGVETTLAEAANKINNLGGMRAEVIQNPPRKYDVSNFYGDSTLTRNILGWEPKIGVDEGFFRFFNDLKTSLEGNL